MAGSKWDGVDDEAGPSSLGTGVTVLKIQASTWACMHIYSNSIFVWMCFLQLRHRPQNPGMACLRHGLVHGLAGRGGLEVSTLTHPQTTPLIDDPPPPNPPRAQVGLSVPDRAAKSTILGQLDDIAKTADVGTRQVGAHIH